MPPVLSKEKEHDNYVRFNYALLNVGTKCVRRVFDKEFVPCTLAEVLKKNRYKLAKIINNDQKTILYPPSKEQGKSPVTSQMFDMTLMICLLRHLAGLDIGDRLPVETNVKVADDLTRLNRYRNMCCHSSETKIDNETFDTISNNILQVVERLGDQGYKEECERILTCSMYALLNDMKYILLQLFIILHTKGYDLCSKVSKKFWSFSASHQFRIILSLLEFHFWLYPPIYVLWNEFQDSYHENSDIKFFQKIECQPDQHDLEDDDCYQSSSAATGNRVTKLPHTIEIKCQNCPNIIEKDKDVNEAQTPNNIIKMVCSCSQGIVAAEVCYMTLFTMLDPRRYRHNHSPTNGYFDHYFILSVKDYIDETDRTTVVKGTDKLSTEMATLTCTQTKQTLTDIERKELRDKPKNTWIRFSPRTNSMEYASAAYYNTVSFDTTGHGLCNQACGGQLH